MMKFPGAFLIIVFALSSCKSTIHYKKELFEKTSSGRNVPYHLATDENATSLAVLLNDNPDTFKLANSSLANELRKNNYAVLIPGKPGDDIFSKNAMDDKPRRLQDLIDMIDALKGNYRDLILIGIGEGGYLVPKLDLNLNPSVSFIINAGPFDPLQEMETLANDSLPLQLAKVLDRKNITNATELLQKIAFIRNNPNSPIDQIAPSTNNYWKSYADSQMYSELLTYYSNPVYWAISERYFLVTEQSRHVIRTLAAQQKNLTFQPLPGTGNFNDKEQMAILVKLIFSHLSMR